MQLIINSYVKEGKEMFKILRAEELTENIFLMEVEAKRVAAHCLPGQFVIVRGSEDGERIPLTICDYDREKGTITIVFQIVGQGTLFLSNLKAGDSFTDFVGPLGCPSEFCNEDIESLKKKSILLSILILEKEMEAVAGNLYVTTDDGSYGRSGMVTKTVEDLVAEGKKYDVCVTIGPMIMMKFVCKLTEKLGIPTVVSLNPIMVDGTGMCGACRVTVGDEVKFACVDGPEFDGHKVNFDEAMRRQTLYKTEEGRAFLAAKEGDTHHGGCGNCN